MLLLPPGDLDPKEYAVARRLTAFTAIPIALALALTGCLPQITTQEVSAPTAVPELDLPPIEFTGELEPGACLESALNQDSNRDSIVPCTEPHLYDVVAVAEWPGMADAVSAGGVRPTWQTITGNSYNADPAPEGYGDWAGRYCTQALRELAGWDDVTIRGESAADLRLVPGGEFAVDYSLANLQDFEAGDRRTVCSVAWSQPISLPTGVSIARLTSSGMPMETRECYLWEANSDYPVDADCAEPHDAQVILEFDARVAFDDFFVSSPDTEDAYARMDHYCTDAIAAVFPQGNDEFRAWGWPDFYNWELSSGGEPLDRPYFVGCAISRLDGYLFPGDAFEGEARRAAEAAAV